MSREQLVDRIRVLIGNEPGLEEREMFGHRAFLIKGNIAIAAGREGDVLVRVRPDQSDILVKTSNAQPAVMQGRPMRGWVRVPPEHVATARQLQRWVRAGAERARTLPAKT